MSIIDSIKRLRLNAYIAGYRLLPLRKNKIILWANSFRQYGCSPKYIAEYILRKYPGRFRLVWVLEDGVPRPDSMPEEIKVVRYFSLEYLKELHTAHFVVCNMRTGPAYMWRKRKGQKYIQTWHSSLRLKKIEKDAEESLPASYVESAKADSDRIDLLISGCDFSTDIFRNSFWYDGEILRSGTPRCDIFFGDSRAIAQKVRNALGIDDTSKIMLYAPTFRKDNRASLHNLDFTAVKTALSERFGGDWVTVYRFHPNIISACSFADAGVDATRYPDMQELITAADILITDYSSCMFDMAVAGKPCMLYAPDMAEYVSRERGLYFNPAELPFPTAATTAELADAVRRFDAGEYRHSIRRLMESVGSYEHGDASGRVVARMLRWM